MAGCSSASGARALDDPPRLSNTDPGASGSVRSSSRAAPLTARAQSLGALPIAVGRSLWLRVCLRLSRIPDRCDSSRTSGRQARQIERVTGREQVAPRPKVQFS